MKCVVVVLITTLLLTTNGDPILETTANTHLVINGHGNKPNIDVRTMHVGCSSDRYHSGSNYIGVVLYQYYGQNSWSLNGHTMRPGYIILVQSDKLASMSGCGGCSMHERAYYYVYRQRIPPPGQLVASGFAYRNGAWIQNSSTFNSVRTPYTDSMQRNGVTAFNAVKKTILNWSNGNGPNLSTRGYRYF